MNYRSIDPAAEDRIPPDDCDQYDPEDTCGRCDYNNCPAYHKYMYGIKNWRENLVMFENVIKKEHGGKTGVYRDAENSLGFAAYKANKTNKNGYVAFSLGKNLLKKARFVVGDRIAILFDKEAGLGLLKRIPDEATREGNRLVQSASKSYLQLRVGLSSSLPVFPPPNGAGTRNIENVIINDEGILFDWPK